MVTRRWGGQGNVIERRIRQRNVSPLKPKSGDGHRQRRRIRKRDQWPV